jgi:hypothetical protein
MLFENFDLVHSHLNAGVGYFSYGDKKFPHVVELTFHRKDRSLKPLRKRSIPNSLDH